MTAGCMVSWKPIAQRIVIAQTETLPFYDKQNLDNKVCKAAFVEMCVHHMSPESKVHIVSF